MTIEIEISERLALEIIAEGGCEHFTPKVSGQCILDGRSPLARYGADLACPPCIAAVALGRVEWPSS